MRHVSVSDLHFHYEFRGAGEMEILGKPIPGARSKTIAGHGPHLTNREQFASIIAEAVSRNAAMPR
ncbi:hypothetical protein [Saccharopolyspora phatthalungensis]|uniref:Pimeloyl-ACP methyl ester carboxylesterase n=1 Tax=Saccharopolyspora phatthalungensis TaxID=664693 RepID=A0A840QE82_9PSEU|nr:hypothetical protein [Saccharopolyspora phatthalungensis]MBB5156785.1 pimeloyl-ACP methyl ester carboxylesterase [Saccharopolyspora phatthalungensis]